MLEDAEHGPLNGTHASTLAGNPTGLPIHYDIGG